MQWRHFSVLFQSVLVDVQMLTAHWHHSEDYFQLAINSLFQATSAHCTTDAAAATHNISLHSTTPAAALLSFITDRVSSKGTTTGRVCMSHGFTNSPLTLGWLPGVWYWTEPSVFNTSSG